MVLEIRHYKNTLQFVDVYDSIFMHDDDDKRRKEVLNQETSFLKVYKGGLKKKTFRQTERYWAKDV